jgi:8-oxo-dGTP pyrophosphatase MutT (NUDIX family)
MQLEKVTAFVTRRQSSGTELLLFRHPFAGVQLPAGTVEANERPDTAALREVREETGLAGLSVVRSLGAIDETLPGRIYIAHRTKVYARPDAGSFGWAEFRRGISVTLERTSGEFMQVTYEEWNDLLTREFATYRITGWVPAAALAPILRRHLFHLVTGIDGPSTWTHAADSHSFEPFWAPLNALPQLIEPQQRWLDHVIQDLLRPNPSTIHR